MASFRKRGKKWEYRVSYTDENGNRKQMSEEGFNTKAEEQVVATDLENKLNKGYKYFRGKQLFPEYYEEWINRYKMVTHSAGSDVFYERTINIVTHYFEKQTLEEITRESYQDFINYYADNRGKERSVETVRKVHAIVSSSLKDAYKSGYITIDPTYRTQLKGRRTKGKQTKFLHKEEAKKLLEELLRDIKPHYITRYMAILPLATGMRISEVMALQEDDIDFETHKISITKSWDYNYTSTFSPTKNRTNRFNSTLILLSSSVIKLILRFRSFLPITLLV